MNNIITIRMKEKHEIVQILRSQRKHSGDVIAENRERLGLKSDQVKKIKKIIENSVIVIPE